MSLADHVAEQIERFARDLNATELGDALTAVVDQHCRWDDGGFCIGCALAVPCPTIRVIADELGVCDDRG